MPQQGVLLLSGPMTHVVVSKGTSTSQVHHAHLMPDARQSKIDSRETMRRVGGPQLNDRRTVEPESGKAPESGARRAGRTAIAPARAAPPTATPRAGETTPPRPRPPPRPG